MKSSQTRFVRGAYSAQIPGISGAFSASTGFPVYNVLRILSLCQSSDSSPVSGERILSVCVSQQDLILVSANSIEDLLLVQVGGCDLDDALMFIRQIRQVKISTRKRVIDDGRLESTDPKTARRRLAGDFGLGWRFHGAVWPGRADTNVAQVQVPVLISVREAAGDDNHQWETYLEQRILFSTRQSHSNTPEDVIDLED